MGLGFGVGVLAPMLYMRVHSARGGRGEGAPPILRLVPVISTSFVSSGASMTALRSSFQGTDKAVCECNCRLPVQRWALPISSTKCMSQSLWTSFFIWMWLYSCVCIARWQRKFLSNNSSRRNAPDDPPGENHSPIAMAGDRYGTWTRKGVGKSALATVGTLNMLRSPCPAQATCAPGQR